MYRLDQKSSSQLAFTGVTGLFEWLCD